MKGKKTASREYQIWLRMRKMCRSKSHVQYKLFGAKGYIVCQRWGLFFSEFLKDMGPIPSVCTGLKFLRKDDRIFDKGNVAWAKESRGRPKKTQNEKEVVRIIPNAAKILLTIEKEYVDKIKQAAHQMSKEIGHIIEPNDVIRDVLKREFPLLEQLDLFTGQPRA